MEVEVLLETVPPEVFAVGLEVLAVGLEGFAVGLEVVDVSAVALVVAPLAPLVALCQLSIPYHHLDFRACKFCTWKTGLLSRSCLATDFASSVFVAGVNDIRGTA